MSSPREELARVIYSSYLPMGLWPYIKPYSREKYLDAADAVIAAGYLKLKITPSRETQCYRPGVGWVSCKNKECLNPKRIRYITNWTEE